MQKVQTLFIVSLDFLHIVCQLSFLAFVAVGIYSLYHVLAVE